EPETEEQEPAKEENPPEPEKEEEPASDPQEPEETVPPEEERHEYVQDFTPVVGTWYAETGGATLEIYEDGMYAFFHHGDLTIGHLVYTEDPEEPWSYMPRYEFYGDNGERMAYTSVSLDENHPGTLTYQVGGGAELFVPDAPEPAVVTVCLPEELTVGYTEMLRDGGEYSMQVAFQTDRPVYDFSILALEYVDMTEEGSVEYSHSTRCVLPELTPDEALVVSMEFLGTIPNNGITYVDTDGRQRFFTVNVSGMDGSLYLGKN
ncbi:MAG: hypothetical protein J6P31_05200, partial [Oscillospiraceae bacterium]|nr:hypothetical protein [Oscillospiraceae bacterium]